MNTRDKGRSPPQPEAPHDERTAGDDPRLALIKKRVERGYYDSDAVIQEIVEAMMEATDRRASK